MVDDVAEIRIQDNLFNNNKLGLALQPPPPPYSARLPHEG